MKQCLYLHRPVVSVLRCYGDLEEVVNRILHEAALGKIDIMDKPAAPDRIGAGKYNVNITEPYYLDLISSYSLFSPRISLRRLLYWFVENEVYVDLGWQQVNKYVDKQSIIMHNKFTNAINELERIKHYTTNSEVLIKLDSICNDLKELQEYVK